MKKLLKAPVFWGILAALVLCMPVIDAYDIIATDATHVVYLEGMKPYPGYGPFSLYSFADGSEETMSALISEGFYPWFTNLDHKMKLFRPIPSLLIYLNHKLSRLTPWGYPLHSLLWYVLVIVLLDRLVCLILPDSRSGGLKPVRYVALLIFVMATRNAFLIAYGGARYYLVVLAFGLAGLIAHIKWRERDWIPGRWLSLCAFLLCLLSGEAALAMVAMLAAYELFGSPEPLKKRIRALLPMAVMVSVYLVFYKLMNYGTAHFEFYTNPFNDPLGFLLALPARLAAMVGELFLGSMSVMGVMSKGAFGPPSWHYYLGGAVTVILVGLLVYPLWKTASGTLRRRLRWLFIGTLAALVPLAAALPNSRLVILPSIGSSIILSFILVHWWRRVRERPKSMVWLGAVVCILLAGIHLVYAPYHWFSDQKQFKFFMNAWDASHRESVLNEIKPHQTAVFLNGTGGDAFMSGFRHRLVNRLPMPAAWWPLSYMEKNNRYVRTGENTLELEMLEGKSLLDTPNVFTAHDPNSPFKKGEVLTFRGLRVRILDLNERGPTRMEFSFNQSLDDPVFVFYKLHKGKLETVSPPAVGESLTM